MLQSGLPTTERQQPSARQGCAHDANSYPVSNFALENRPLDDVRALRVAVVGAGLSGILAGIFPMETQITYYAKLLRKVSSQRIKSIAPLRKAADDFVEYSDAYFPTTVLTENCSSWANGGRPGAHIHGLWPGSAAHVTLVRRDPRWEDWEYEYLSSSGNRFAYLGNGWTKKEQDPSSDMTSYLKLPEDTDLRSLHEGWCDL